jgi:hypothetical protein
MPEDSNPFATRFTRPGAIPFDFAPGSAREGVDRLAAHGWWGQIIGPHGSGKSTLLHSLRPELAARGREVVWITQGPGERRLALAPHEIERWTPATQVIVDGYEQLGWLARKRLQSRCRQANAGLLVTAHEDVGLPLLYETSPSEETLQQLVQRLLSPEQRPLIGAEDVSRCYQAHAGNLREALFALYDLYERRSRQGS